MTTPNRARRTIGRMAGYALTIGLLAVVASQVPWGALKAEAGLAGPPAPAPVAAAEQPAGDAAGTDTQPRWEGGSLTVTAWHRSFAVVPVGLTDERELIPPRSTKTIGWWAGGVAPGSHSGTAVLAVHRDSRQDGRGPFAELENLPLGSIVVVDGHTYRLTDVETYSKKALPVEQAFRQDGPHRLALVTCGGSYHRSNGWDSNVIAFFEPVTGAA
jgi:hypothetical protein